ncbi:MAG: response regulator [Thermodesulfobacteriota bacterium]
MLKTALTKADRYCKIEGQSEMKDLIHIFKVESEEHLTKLEHGLIELEKTPKDKELLQRLNREVHTLKGAARVFGFTEIQDLAHRIEDIFEAILSEKAIFDSYCMDQILKGIDTIRILLDHILCGEGLKLDLSEIHKNLQSCISRKGKERDRKINEVPTPQEGKTHIPQHPAEEYLRVPLSRVDRLLYLVGEVVIQKMKSSAKVVQAKKLLRLTKEIQRSFSNLREGKKESFVLSNGEGIKSLSQCEAQLERLREEVQKLHDQVSLEVFHLNPIVDQLQTKAREIKMLPLSVIFDGFPRMVRDLAFQQGKEINLFISGEETELDKKVMERIKSSLIHILRNAIDHGIEEPDKRESMGKPRQGTIKVSALNEGDRVIISVEDDGRGIDLEDIKDHALKKGLFSKEELSKMTEKEILDIIFMSGYSSSSKVTELSGRGIGLDIVMREIGHLGGRVMVESKKGQGTRFTLLLPLSVAIIRALLIRVKESRFFLPMVSVIKVIRIKEEKISTVNGSRGIFFEDHIIPLLDLGEVLMMETLQEDRKREGEMLWVVIVANQKKEMGLWVDEVLGNEEIFLKSLGKHLGKVRYISGATITLEGEVILVLDVEDLFSYKLVQTLSSQAERMLLREAKKKARILVVEDAFSTRELERSILENQGYLVDTAVDGLDALDRLSRQSYDLILTDLEMPRMDGFELCRTLRKTESYRHIPIVIVTAFQKEEDRRRGLEVGASAYLVKGTFDQVHLLETIDRLIE